MIYPSTFPQDDFHNREDGHCRQPIQTRIFANVKRLTLKRPASWHVVKYVQKGPNNHQTELTTSRRIEPKSSIHSLHPSQAHRPISKRLRAVNLDARRSRREVSLSRNNLVVVLPEIHALASPRIKVRLHIHASTGALVLAHRPVLLKGLGTINRRLVSTRALRNLVAGAIRGHGALVLGLARRVVCAEVLDNVVLDEGVARPAVDGEVAVAIGVVGAAVGNGACGTGVPAFAANEVAA